MKYPYKICAPLACPLLKLLSKWEDAKAVEGGARANAKEAQEAEVAEAFYNQAKESAKITNSWEVSLQQFFERVKNDSICGDCPIFPMQLRR